MIRALTLLGIACLVGGIALTVIDARDNAPIAIPLVLVAFAADSQHRPRRVAGLRAAP